MVPIPFYVNIHSMINLLRRMNITAVAKTFQKNQCLKYKIMDFCFNS